EKLDDYICRHLHLNRKSTRMNAWRTFVKHVISPKRQVTIAVVGKYIELKDAYKSIYESLTHAGAHHECGIKVVNVDAEKIEEVGAARLLRTMDGILVPGGFGNRGTEGKIAAAAYARKSKKPY